MTSDQAAASAASSAMQTSSSQDLPSSLPHAVAHHHELSQKIIALCANGQGSWAAVVLEHQRLACFSLDDIRASAQIFDFPSAILNVVADADGLGFLLALDDGQLFLVEPAEHTQRAVLTVQTRQLGAMACSSARGLRAVSCGEDVLLLDDEWRTTTRFSVHGGAVALAFNPKGQRLAVAEGHGISLWWTQGEPGQKGQALPFHVHPLNLLWSPDGKIILAGTREAALVGWRLADDKPMQMQGYAAPITSWQFSASSKWLITSGADAGVAWPFFAGGPWGKNPTMLGPERDGLVTCVACNPKDEMVALGYDDGMIVLAPLADQMPLQIHPALDSQGDHVVGMAWNSAGDTLIVALASGHIMFFTFDSIQAAVQARLKT